MRTITEKVMLLKKAGFIALAIIFVFTACSDDTATTNSPILSKGEDVFLGGEPFTGDLSELLEMLVNGSIAGMSYVFQRDVSSPYWIQMIGMELGNGDDTTGISYRTHSFILDEKLSKDGDIWYRHNITYPKGGHREFLTNTMIYYRYKREADNSVSKTRYMPFDISSSFYQYDVEKYQDISKLQSAGSSLLAEKDGILYESRMMDPLYGISKQMLLDNPYSIHKKISDKQIEISFGANHIDNYSITKDTRDYILDLKITRK